MAICDSCQKDDHAKCSGRVRISWPRLDRRHKRPHGSRVVECECVCKQPEGWRGEPQPLPQGFGRRWR